jgi:hypothetical protein
MDQLCDYLNSGLRGAVGWTALLLFLGLIIWSLGRVATQFDLGTDFFARFRGIFNIIITTVILLGYLIPLAGPFLEEVLSVQMPCDISISVHEAPQPEPAEPVAGLLARASAGRSAALPADRLPQPRARAQRLALGPGSRRLHYGARRTGGGIHA